MTQSNEPQQNLSPAGEKAPALTTDQEAQTDESLALSHKNSKEQLARFLEEEAAFEAREKKLETFERSVEEIAKRMLCLLAVAARAANFLSRESFLDFAKPRDLMDSFTPRELAFALADSLDPREAIQMSWRIEGCSVLVWVLGWGPKQLGPSVEQTNPADIWAHVAQLPVDFWRERALPQNWREDANEALFLAHEEHWRANDARYRKALPPDDFHSGIAIERHHALNWLFGYTDGDWEETWLDT